jgi:nascent polypeptide-associated complex subunit alpha
MMQKMGMNMDSVADVNQVIIRTASKDIIIDEPEVAILQVQGQKMYQVIGGQVSEQAPSKLQSAATAKPAFSEEDVQLVADQTGKSLQKAKEALMECDGDLAKAILLLQS